LEFVKVMSKVLSAYISTIIFLCVNKFASIFLRQCKMAFYWWSIVVMFIFCIVSKTQPQCHTLIKNHSFVVRHCTSRNSPLRMTASGFCHELWNQKTKTNWLENFCDILNCFNKYMKVTNTKTYKTAVACTVFACNVSALNIIKENPIKRKLFDLVEVYCLCCSLSAI